MKSTFSDSASVLLWFLLVGLPSIFASADEKLPPNRWIKLDEQKRADEVNFRRQTHGGSCFDSKRGRLILFGSDTHGRDWTNSPLLFDVASRQWSRVYSNDGRATYAVTDDGVPVAGTKGEHPWAMHTVAKFHRTNSSSE